MVLEVILFVVLAILIAIIANGVFEYHNSSKRENMSFKEAIDLTELPIVTFYNGKKKINFLLDTGSNSSHINKSILPSLNHKVLTKVESVVGIEGNPVNTMFCEMTITYKKQKFTDEFCISNLDDAFASIKEESGVQIHGILGSKFFEKYKYVLDFNSLVAYYK